MQETVQRWAEILNDLAVYQPTLGLRLFGTDAQAGPFDETPFSLTVVFPPQKQEDFEFLRRRPDLQRNIADYFREVLERPVELKLDQTARRDTSGMQRVLEQRIELTPGGTYEIDLGSVPLLKRLQELFDAKLVSTRPMAGTETGEKDEHPEDDEGYAEDAEQADAGPG